MCDQHARDGRTPKGRYLLWTKWGKLNSWQIHSITERIESVQFHVKARLAQVCHVLALYASQRHTCWYSDRVSSSTKKRDSHRNCFPEPYVGHIQKKKIIRRLAR